MPSQYPGAVDNLPTNKLDSTFTENDHATHHNDVADAINKVENELGANPSGGYATLRQRLDDIGSDPGSGGIPRKNVALEGDGTGVVGTSSTAVTGLTSDSSRIEFGIWNNHATNVVYLGLGEAAVVGRGPVIYPGGPPFTNNTFTGTVNAIATGASTPISFYAV